MRLFCFVKDFVRGDSHPNPVLASVFFGVERVSREFFCLSASSAASRPSRRRLGAGARTQFPMNFAGRVMDMLMAERSFAVVLRVALELLVRAAPAADSDGNYQETGARRILFVEPLDIEPTTRLSVRLMFGSC